MLPDIWKIATRTNAVLKSKKNNARGKKIVEDPNPAVVPIISENSAAIQKSMPAMISNNLHAYLKLWKAMALQKKTLIRKRINADDNDHKTPLRLAGQ